MKLGKKLVLCSTFKGKLVDKAGNPVSGARIQRSWNWIWANTSGADETTSGSDGTFVLPEVVGRSWSAAVIPHEPLIKQEITAHGRTGEMLLWSFVKRDYDHNGELTGRPINVICGMEEAPPGKLLFTGTCVEAS